MTPEAQASILLVDDTVENLRILSRMLGKRGFEVRAVTNGPEALEAVAHDPPDLILLDISMPEMSGFEVCAKLKASRVSQEIPIIFLTALSELGDKLRGFAAGGADYITKPFQFEEVVARVSQQVALRSTQKQLAANLVRLQELERMRDDLVHMVVHDMRSPLNALIMSLEIMERHVGSECTEVFRYALQGAQRLNGMADTLLDLSRLEADRMPIVKVACDLSRILDEVQESMRVLEPDRAIEGDFPHPLMWTCDAALVRRVVENLISNGIKHTPRGGRLQVSAKRLSDRVRVEVRDEGPGVPLDLQSHIFEKFSAATAKTNRVYHSVGIGLAFCKLAIQAQGGSIGVDALNPGSRFWFELPA